MVFGSRLATCDLRLAVFSFRFSFFGVYLLFVLRCVCAFDCHVVLLFVFDSVCVVRVFVLVLW